MIFIFYLPTFSNTSSNRFSIFSLSHLNIISSLIISSFFNTHIRMLSSPLLSLLIFLFSFILLLMYSSPSDTPFFANFLFSFILLLMYSSPSNLMSYCSWAPKKSWFRESIRNHFLGLILYYRDYFAFT